MAKKRFLAALCLMLALTHVSSGGAAEGPPFEMPPRSENVPRPNDLVPAGEPDAVETRRYRNATVVVESYGSDTIQHVYPDAETAECIPGNIENSRAPEISGTPSPGQLLTVSNGSWIVCGAYPVGYSYRWSTGVSSQTYLVQSSDVGRQVNATVTACTSEDCAAATSNTVTITSSGGGGGGGGGGGCSENDPSQLFSEFVGMTAVPGTVQPGQQFSVSITFRNAGQCTWTGSEGYRLGSQNPENNENWGFNRVYLGAGEAIAPGQGKTFVLNARAPSAPGTYGFQWRMVREFVNWFGPSTPNATVTVNTQSSSPPPEYTTPGTEAEVDASTHWYSGGAGERCFWAKWKDDKGSLVYYRKVTQQVDWCSKQGHITRYSVNQWPDNGVYCKPNWGPKSAVVAGGVGAGSVTILSRGGFECDLPYLGLLSDYVEVDVRYRYDGRREDV